MATQKTPDDMNNRPTPAGVEQDINRTSADHESASSASFDDLIQEAEESTKSRKPGSQSNSSDQGNNGRGGGK